MECGLCEFKSLLASEGAGCSDSTEEWDAPAYNIMGSKIEYEEGRGGL